MLEGDEGRHAARVKRALPDELLLLGDGRGALLTCRVRTVEGARLTLTVDGRDDVPAPDPSVTVVQALPKGERGELAVELATELGVDVVVPWDAERDVTRWRGDRAEKGRARWERTAREAAKQSRRAWTPEVTDLATSAEVAARMSAAALSLVLHSDDLTAGTPLGEVDLPTAGEIVVVVGPEGGISPAEVERFTAAGARLVRLGPEVLRTSTAGAATLAALAGRLGRWV